MAEALILVFIVVLMIAFVVGSIIYMTHYGNRLSTTKTEINNEISEISDTITQHSMKDAQHSSALTKVQSEQNVHEAEINLLKKEDAKVYSMLDTQRARLDEAYNLLNVKEETLNNQISALSNQLNTTQILAALGAGNTANITNVEVFTQNTRIMDTVGNKEEVKKKTERDMIVLEKKTFPVRETFQDADAPPVVENSPQLDELLSITPEDLLGGYSFDIEDDKKPFEAQPLELPSHAKITKFEGRVIGDSLEGDIVKTDRVMLGDKFLMSGVGEAHGNDKWLRLFDADGKGYNNNGIAAARGWFGNQLHSSGNAYFRGNVDFKGGTSEHNPRNWGTHFPWRGNNKNYIRGDTEIRGNTQNVGDLRVGRNLGVNGNINIGNGKTINSGPGRLHIHGGERLYLLNKSGVIVGREWGGSGNLQVQGSIDVRGKLDGKADVVGKRLCVEDVCVDKATLQNVLQKAEAPPPPAA